MKGKGAIFLVDGMAMQAPRGNMPPEMAAAQPKIGQPNDAGLNELLEKYGFKINQDFVLDSPRVPGPIDMPDGRKMLANVPVYVAVKTSGDDKELSVLESITRAGVSVRQLRRAGRPARRRQAAGRQAVAARQDHAHGVEAHRHVLLLADDEDRRGQGQGLVRPRVRVPGTAQERVRARRGTRACRRPTRPARRRRSRRSRCG